MDRTQFTARTTTGELGGWLTGDGPPVLVLHGGPGLGHEYMDEVVAELADRYRVATFQQRGLAPSVLDGEFTIDEAVADIVAVLDELRWDSAYLLGHSWGGHLALHVAATVPERLSGVLSVDPLGAVGDGGAAAFGAELVARLTDASRPAFEELAGKEAAEGLTPEEEMHQLRLLWPGYFADPTHAPEMPPTRISQTANHRLWADIVTRLPRLEAALADLDVPVGVVVGEGSPMPVAAGVETADRIAGAWSSVIPASGHFVWVESPGALLAAMDRLATSTSTGQTVAD